MTVLLCWDATQLVGKLHSAALSCLCHELHPFLSHVTIQQGSPHHNTVLQHQHNKQQR
jgi:hypothetical protein